MKKMSDYHQNSKRVWENNLKEFPHTKLRYPDENLVRLFCGRYIDLPKPPAKLLDHGFGHGNNLTFFLDQQYECYGCEIAENLVNDVQTFFDSTHQRVDLRLIEGIEIPFDDNFFDVVVSWGVIHYLGNKQRVKQTISELHRILKPGGTLIVSTVHPKSSFNDRFRPLEEEGSYLVERESRYDNRQGLVFYMAGNDEDLKKLFSSFSRVKLGHIFIDLFNYEQRNAWALACAIK